MIEIKFGLNLLRLKIDFLLNLKLKTHFLLNLKELRSIYMGWCRELTGIIEFGRNKRPTYWYMEMEVRFYITKMLKIEMNALYL